MISVITSLDTNVQFLKQLSQGTQKVVEYDPFKGEEKNKPTNHTNKQTNKPEPATEKDQILEKDFQAIILKMWLTLMK